MKINHNLALISTRYYKSLWPPLTTHRHRQVFFLNCIFIKFTFRMVACSMTIKMELARHFSSLSWEEACIEIKCCLFDCLIAIHPLLYVPKRKGIKIQLCESDLNAP